jgi:hypothetical protein
MTSEPSLATIGEIQNSEESLRNRSAAGYFYRRAKWLHFGGASLTVVLALVSPLVLFFLPSAGPKLGAFAGAWIVLSRLALEPIRRGFQRKGAAAQERFDCQVLGLEWNDALARPLPDEEIRAASESTRHCDTVRDWYPADQDAAWPESVLICQRANTVWARRQHGIYATVVWIAALVWLIVGVVAALSDSASLADYLIIILLPSLPAFLDSVELARDHRDASIRREVLEIHLDTLLRSGASTAKDLREVQDELFRLRAGGPLVPEWFYKVIRGGYEKDMRYAAYRAAQAVVDGKG